MGTLAETSTPKASACRWPGSSVSRVAGRTWERVLRTQHPQDWTLQLVPCPGGRVCDKAVRCRKHMKQTRRPQSFPDRGLCHSQCQQCCHGIAWWLHPPKCLSSESTELAPLVQTGHAGGGRSPLPPCIVAQSRALRNEHSPGSRRGPGGSGGTYAVHTQNDDVNTLAVSVPNCYWRKR